MGVVCPVYAGIVLLATHHYGLNVQWSTYHVNKVSGVVQGLALGYTFDDAVSPTRVHRHSYCRGPLVVVAALRLVATCSVMNPATKPA